MDKRLLSVVERENEKYRRGDQLLNYSLRGRRRALFVGDGDAFWLGISSAGFWEKTNSEKSSIIMGSLHCFLRHSLLHHHLHFPEHLCLSPASRVAWLRFLRLLPRRPLRRRSFSTLSVDRVNQGQANRSSFGCYPLVSSMIFSSSRRQSEWPMARESPLGKQPTTTDDLSWRWQWHRRHFPMPRKWLCLRESISDTRFDRRIAWQSIDRKW